MAVHYRTQGFCIKKVDRGEVDQFLTFYTKDYGKLEVLGKAIRKIKSKLRPGAELFYLSEIEFIQGKTHKTLIDAVLIEKFENLRKDLKRLKIAHKIIENLDDLIKGQEADEKIWHLLIETFEKLNSLNSKVKRIENSLSVENPLLEILHHYFLWNFLTLSGYQLELYFCSLCQKKVGPQNLFFNPKEGGLICHQCSGFLHKIPKKIDAETVKIIRLLLKKDWPILKKLKIEKENLNSLKVISDCYFSEILKEVK
ncbi:MAG: DNA repair protein RecO [Candidatus Nealsonbacteria bacterium]|nr:DNA repair protein RecO [Candidatus Nealsonbacteria bacterium]